MVLQSAGFARPQRTNRFDARLFGVATLVCIFFLFRNSSGSKWRFESPRISCELAQQDFTDKRVRRLKKNIPTRPLVSALDAWLKPEAARFGPAVETIPEVLLEKYTLNGKIPVESMFYDQAYLGGKAFATNWTLDLVNYYRKSVRNRTAVFNYDNSPLYEFFDARGQALIKNARGLVVGSEIPWLEAFLLESGAKHVTTLEFGEIKSDHPQISSITPQKFTRAFLSGEIPQFDFAITYSSLEHDGLGRYGDMLNPDGDLQSMVRLMHAVKPGGFVFIGVPCCYDKLDWNAHRIYGPLRLAMLFAGYNVVGVHPADTKLGDTKVGFMFQPLWVLQNRLGCPDYPKTPIFSEL